MNPVEALAGGSTYTTTYIGVAALIYSTAFGVPIPEEITMVLAGVAAYEGAMHMDLLLPIAGLAVLVADTQIYLIGRHFGRPLLERRFFRLLLPPERIARVEVRFAGHWVWAIFAVRFVSGLRAATYFTSGTLRVPFYKFFLTDFLAVCIHVTIFTSLGYIFSPKVESIVSFIKSADRWMAVTAFLAFVMFAVFIGYVVGKHRKKK